ncbi:hypothetical protein LEP1GSC050_2947 [Leptospira broomii serovar Hurstbridge str. 5399]|uniref:Uncharacterized protein n=1 Tax=Leptospira broomii serovar Hurstbridge str. 5399 TaxID=1049789 RepID=T0EZ26_9LEPT|nr:hypothetical protein LEP1GSC050_2947 [Leptospira broomii serovar Hurstbridge str. 5399]
MPLFHKNGNSTTFFLNRSVGVPADRFRNFGSRRLRWISIGFLYGRYFRKLL